MSIHELGIVRDTDGALRLRGGDTRKKFTRVTDSGKSDTETEILPFTRPSLKFATLHKPSDKELEDPTLSKVRGVEVFRRYACQKVKAAVDEENPTLRRVHLMNAEAALEVAKTVTPGGIEARHKIHAISEAIKVFK